MKHFCNKRIIFSLEGTATEIFVQKLRRINQQLSLCIFQVTLCDSQYLQFSSKLLLKLTPNYANGQAGGIL
jgi:hypothetical protein